MHEWQIKTLTDGKGKVYDNIRNSSRRGRRLSTFSLTYNQGTYIGGSVLLYLKTKEATYLDEATKAADWTRANLCTGADHILRSENQGDGGAFKGIFVRYMKLLVYDGGRTEYLPWMKANADTAWRNRRKSDSIMGYDWSAAAGEQIECQSAASAVSLLLCFPDDAKH